MLVDNIEFIFKLHQPVGIKNLSDENVTVWDSGARSFSSKSSSCRGVSWVLSGLEDRFRSGSRRRDSFAAPFLFYGRFLGLYRNGFFSAVPMQVRLFCAYCLFPQQGVPHRGRLPKQFSSPHLKGLQDRRGFQAGLRSRQLCFFFAGHRHLGDHLPLLQRAAHCLKNKVIDLRLPGKTNLRFAGCTLTSRSFPDMSICRETKGNL